MGRRLVPWQTSYLRKEVPTTSAVVTFAFILGCVFAFAGTFAGLSDLVLFGRATSRVTMAERDGLFASWPNGTVLAPEVTEISPAVEPVVTELSPGVRICLISPGDASTCIDRPVFDQPRISVFVQPQITDVSQASDQEDISLPGIRISLISPADVASTPTVKGAQGRFTSAKENKRGFGALSTTPRTPVSGHRKTPPSASECLLLSQPGGSIRDGASHASRSRIRDRGEMESGPVPDETGQAHKSNPATRTLGTEFADMAVVVVTPTEPVAPKTRKVSCCKVRFPPPIVNHILISFFCCN